MRSGGLAEFTIEGKVVEQIRTITCPHCNCIARLGGPELGWCAKCHAATCIPCGRKDTCDVFVKKLMRAEARSASRRSMGL